MERFVCTQESECRRVGVRGRVGQHRHGDKPRSREAHLMSTADLVLSNPLRSRGRGLLGRDVRHGSASCGARRRRRAAGLRWRSTNTPGASTSHPARGRATASKSQAKAAGIANALKPGWVPTSPASGSTTPTVSSSCRGLRQDRPAVAKQFEEYGLGERRLPYRCSSIPRSPSSRAAQRGSTKSIKNLLAEGRARQRHRHQHQLGRRRNRHRTPAPSSAPTCGRRRRRCRPR